jgi:solute carrier family 25 protein 33/36
LSSNEDIRTEQLNPAIYLATASVAKLIAAAATYPHEVIRTRLREANNTKYDGLVSGLIRIGKEEGYRGLYGGMGAHLIRVVPNAAIMFLTYEMVVQALSYDATVPNR